MITSHVLNTAALFTHHQAWPWWFAGWWWWWPLGPLTLGILLAAVAITIWLLVRGGRNGDWGIDRAHQILRERYALGEIDDDEYHRRTGELG